MEFELISSKMPVCMAPRNFTCLSSSYPGIRLVKLKENEENPSQDDNHGI